MVSQTCWRNYTNKLAQVYGQYNYLLIFALYASGLLALEETVRAATETWCVTFAAEMQQTEKLESSTCLVHLTTKTTE